MKLMLCSSAVALVTATGAFAQDYPMTIASKFGSATLDEKPLRVVSLDYNGADDLLALGVQPVAIRHWYGDYPQSVWPWAQPLLTTTPEILKGDLNFEQIAATDPDVIIALWSGITADDYARLSLIAPVVAVPEGTGDWEMAWDDRALLVGQVTGTADAAQAQVTAIQDQMTEVRAAHPDWAGKTAAVAYLWSDVPGAYASGDIRPKLLNGLGFINPPMVDEMVGPDGFTATLSVEDLRPIDGDLIMWLATDDDYTAVQALPARQQLEAVKAGRELFIDAQLSSALSHSTLLSLPFAIDQLTADIAAVLD